MLRQLLARGRPDAGVNFLAQVDDVALVAPIAVEELHEDRFQRQHFADEPSRNALRTGGHGMLPRFLSFATVVRTLDHPPRTSCQLRVRSFAFSGPIDTGEAGELVRSRRIFSAQQAS